LLFFVFFYLDVCRESPHCGGGYCKPNYNAIRGYSCVCQGGVIKTEPCPFSKSKFLYVFFYIEVLYLLLDCPITNCGTQGICVETDGIVVTNGARPIYYVCLCQEGYISAGDCNGKIIYKRNFF